MIETFTATKIQDGLTGPGKQEPGIAPKPYSIGELAAMYGLSRRAFKRQLEPIASRLAERRGRFYRVREVKLIFEFLGEPVL